ncbi:MAG TPA: ImmA/IrrE family metallo-endopeptidase [Candidatus Methylacidiphilales bacterium]|jgi:hypothetical protein|nr:ImmA/IrrE family metallo-endopeptidase [Candidatus Methylacidiphilales bacterium]
MAKSSPTPKLKRRRKSLAEKIHPSVIALMKEALADECPIDVIRRKCRAMVNHGRSYGWKGPPFDPKALAGLHDIIVEETHTPMDGEGQILPRHGKTVIQYRAGILPQRQRFTICHELAHTCFPDIFDFVRRRGAESDEDKAHRQFENLCHVGAGELLMPFPEFHQSAIGHYFNGELVHALATEFDASLDATIKRLIDCSTEPCGAAFLTDEAFSTFGAWKGRNRVVWYWHNDAMKGYVPSGTLVPESSACNKCVATSADIPASRETWYIANSPRSFYVEALRLPAVPEKPDYPKVAAILHSKRPTTLS